MSWAEHQLYTCIVHCTNMSTLGGTVVYGVHVDISRSTICVRVKYWVPDSRTFRGGLESRLGNPEPVPLSKFSKPLNHRATSQCKQTTRSQRPPQ